MRNNKRLLIILCSFAIFSSALTIAHSMKLKGEEPDEQINPTETKETKAPIKAALDGTTNSIKTTVSSSNQVEQTSVVYVQEKVNLRKVQLLNLKFLSKYQGGLILKPQKKVENGPR